VLATNSRGERFMFIKWRTYRRQKYHQKGDKYFLQPVLVESYRVSKKQLEEFSENHGVVKEKLKGNWETHKKKIGRPRHHQVYRFPSFPSCAYVHYDDPNYIEYRKHYWEKLEVIFERALPFLSKNDQQKILDEIETILPKPYGHLLEILERAYTAGMPIDPSPKEYYESKEM
jgi:hypothetical protein